MPRLRVDDGIQIHYDDQGQGEPLVFVHGWMMSSAVWEKQVQHFAGTNRVVTPDLRGCGDSETRAGTYSMARYAADLHQLLTQLDLQEVTLVGWSMGGGVTMEYLARHGPGRVRAIGLVDFPPQLQEDPAVADKVCANLLTKRDTFLEGFMRRMVLDPGAKDVPSKLFEQAMRCRPETACEMYRAMRPTGPGSNEPLQVPAYLAFPKNGWFRPALDEWRRRLPDHVAPEFDRSKHCPFLEEPDAFNTTLASFLRSKRP